MFSSRRTVRILTQDEDCMESQEIDHIHGYYLFHSKIYDLTRWSFLFGRSAAVQAIPKPINEPLQILEVGCGTGRNTLRMLKRFPNAHITALDLSPEMMVTAKKKLEAHSHRVTFLETVYGDTQQFDKKFDVVFMSYMLTMLRQGHPKLIEQASKDLAENGVLCIADFENTNCGLYYRLMNSQNVQVEGQLLPLLDKNFTAIVRKIGKAYFGVWTYLVYVGTPK